MIKYTGNDIISRAEQIADLEHSDFISDEEKLALLNESFLMLYQKVIDSNDKLFTTTGYARSGMFLPPDFYQLIELYVERTKEPIPKKNSVQKKGYEIVNGRLYYSREYQDETVVIQYAKIPPTIFIKEKTIDSPYVNAIAANDNIFVHLDDQENIIISDIYSDTVVDLGPKSATPFTDIAVFSNGILLKNENQILLYRFDTNEIGTIGGDKIPAISQNTIYLFDIGTKQVVDLDYNVYIPELDIDFDYETAIIYFNPMATYQVGANFYICNKFDKVDIGAIKLKCSLVDCLYAVATTGKLWKLKYDGVELVRTEYTPIGIVSDKYVLTRRAFGNVDFLEGLRDSTLLDYPNNLFFVTLSYMLAIQFKIKQSADITALSAVYEEVKNQFFDSLNRDANQFYQINNVYRGRNWIYG